MFILLYTVVSFAGSWIGNDPAVCNTEIFGEVSAAGRPTYWGQLRLRPSDARVYLTTEESEHPTTFGLIDEDPIDFGHPQFKSLVDNDKDCPPGRTNCHGAEVLAVLCSHGVCSVAPPANTRAKYIALGFGKSEPTPFNHALHSALVEIRDHNLTAKPGEKIRVVNISLSGFKDRRLAPRTKSVLEALQRSDELNITWSAGNVSHEKDFFGDHPFQFILPIGATQSGRDGLAHFSSFGRSTMFVAPGEGVRSISPKLIEGTSFAAPMVAGAFVTLHKVQPGLTAMQARAILKATAQDVGESGQDLRFGFGIPNIPLATAVARSLKTELNVDRQITEDALIKRVQARVAAREFSVLWPECGAEGLTRTQEIAASQFDEQRPEDLLAAPWANCQELRCRFERASVGAFLSETQPTRRAYVAQMCSFYRAISSPWGTAQYCPLGELDDAQRREVLNLNPEVLLTPSVLSLPEWPSLVRTLSSEFVAEHILLHPAVMQRGDWGTIIDEFVREYPSSAVTYLFEEDVILQHPRASHWLGLVARTSLESAVRVKKAAVPGSAFWTLVFQSVRTKDSWPLRNVEPTVAFLKSTKGYGRPEARAWIESLLEVTRKKDRERDETESVIAGALLDQMIEAVLADPVFIGLSEWPRWAQGAFESIAEKGHFSSFVQVLSEPKAMKHENWRSWMEKTIEKDPSVASSVLLTDGVLARPDWNDLAERVFERSIVHSRSLLASRGGRAHPKWRSWAERASVEDPGALEYVLESADSILPADYDRWMRRVFDDDRSIAARLLRKTSQVPTWSKVMDYVIEKDPKLALAVLGDTRVQERIDSDRLDMMRKAAKAAHK